MKTCSLALATLALLFNQATPLRAQAPAPEAPAPAATAGDAADASAAIRQAAADFVAAFNRGDAAAVAAHWLEEGEYIDEAGRLYAGRAAIEAEYASFFQEHPGVTMHVTIDSVRRPAPGVVIEEGRATLDPPPAGAPAASQYSAVHVQVDGKWLMASVRDMRIETTSAYQALAPLEWMIGSWRAEEHGKTAESTCRWVANKSYIQRSYRVTDGEHVASSGEQLIGRNPLTGGIQSWSFASDGGHAVGSWTPTNYGWVIESQGVLPDGTITSAATVITPLDSDAFAWQSVGRSAAGAAMPDTGEIVFRRQTDQE